MMKLFKSYWATHRDEVISADILIFIALATSIIAKELGSKENYQYCFGVAVGIIVMLAVNLVAHYGRTK